MRVDYGAVELRRSGNGETVFKLFDLRTHGVPRVSVSVGAAVASVPDQPIDELVAEADAALYRAKRAGRDRVVAA